MAVNRLAAVNVLQEMLLASYELVICEFPLVGIYFSEALIEEKMPTI